jgi:hypothetical protein
VRLRSGQRAWPEHDARVCDRKTKRRGGQADGGTEHGRLQPRPRRPYAERLLFEVPQGGTEGLDESMITEAILSQAAGKLKDAVTGADGGDEATDRRTAS